MHIVGVIIHGNPDRRYFFAVYPHLAGDSNLNLECIRLALLADRKHFALGCIGVAQHLLGNALHELFVLGIAAEGLGPVHGGRHGTTATANY